MSFRRINKEFCLTDDSVNCYGYRLLTAGLRLDRFKPAIGFLMHEREKGVAVKWSDFRVEGDKVFAKPSVNQARFYSLAEEIENGFYCAASVGNIVALEISNEENLKIEGQTGPTVTKWYPREISIVDIPGNYNAVTQEEDLKYDSSFAAFAGLEKLFDEQENVLIDLSAFNNSKNNSNNPKKYNEMDKATILVSSVLSFLPDLAADATSENVIAAIAALSAQAKKAVDLETKLAELMAAQAREKVSVIVAKGLAERRLTRQMADKLEKDYGNNPEGLQALIDAAPAQTLVTGALKDGEVPEKYIGKSFNDLYLSGELEELRANYPDYYKTLKDKK